MLCFCFGSTTVVLIESFPRNLSGSGCYCRGPDQYKIEEAPSQGCLIRCFAGLRSSTASATPETHYRKAAVGRANLLRATCARSRSSSFAAQCRPQPKAQGV